MSSSEQPEAGKQLNPYATQVIRSSEPPGAVHIVLLDAQGQLIQTVELTTAGVTIGRLSTSNLVLTDPSVSRNHLRVEWDGQIVKVTDLGSKLGTQLGATRLEPQTPHHWTPEQSVRVGRYTLQLHFGDVPVAAPAAVAPVVPPALSAPTRHLLPAEVDAVPAAAAAVAPAAGHPVRPEPAGEAPPPVAPLVPPVAPSQAPVAAEAPVALAIAPDQITLMLTPGERAIVDVRVMNRAAQPLTITLDIDGLPPGWVEVSPTVRVAAGGKASGSLVVHVPASSDSRAGAYPVTIQAIAAELPEMLFEAPLEWRVAPLLAGELVISPKRASDREQALYTLALRNHGNIHTTYVLSATDSDQALVFAFAQARLTAPPGELVETTLTVSLDRRLVGRDQRYGFSVRAVEADAHQAPPTTLVADAQFVQTAVVPFWLIPAALTLLLLALLCGFAILPASLAGMLPGYGILAAPTELPLDLRATAAAAATIRAQELQYAELQGQATLAALAQTATAAPADQQVALQATLEAQFATASAIPAQLTTLPTIPPPTDAPFATAEPGAAVAPTVAPAVATVAPSPTVTRTATRTAQPTQTPAPSLPALTIADADIQRLTTGETTLVFVVRLSAAGSTAITVQYATEDDTARAGDDYRSISGSLLFNPAEIEKTISVTVLPSSTTASEVRMRLVLTNAVGANLDDGDASGVIRPASASGTATITATSNPAATATSTTTPAPTATATSTSTPTATSTPNPVISAPSSIAVPQSANFGSGIRWTRVQPVTISGVPDTDMVTVTIDISDGLLDRWQILNPDGIPFNAGERTFNATLVSANDRLTRLEYASVAVGSINMTIRVTHDATGTSQTAVIAMNVSAP